MREAEMRRRIEGFLERRMRGMLAPALGLGLAMAGCGDWGGSEYMAQFPRDGAGGAHDVGAPSDVPVYSAPVSSDGPMADTFGSKDTSSPADGMSDISGMVDTHPKPELDAAKDAAGEDAAGSEAHPGVDAGTGVDVGSDLGMRL